MGGALEFLQHGGEVGDTNMAPISSKHIEIQTYKVEEHSSGPSKLQGAFIFILFVFF